MLPMAIIILLLVLIGIACRQLLPISIPIWIFMLVGAVLVLALREITLSSAWDAISIEIIVYLFGVFVIAEGLEQSGYLEEITDTLFNKAKTGFQVLILLATFTGFGAALLMNDTMAIIGTPVILQLCRRQPKLITPLLLGLAYSISIGSVMSPIGNPQNLLIAIQGKIDSPFIVFIMGLFIPTVINLVLTVLIIYVFFKKNMSASLSHITPAGIRCQRTARLSKISVCLMICLILIKIAISVMHINFDLDFSLITLISALPILVGSQQRLNILKKLDWGTLIFFIGMFVLMQSVWDSGYFQSWIHESHFVVKKVSNILIISTLLSQLISNVPLVALYIPLLKHAGAQLTHYLALAAGSTVAGNLFVFGAASNIIILQNAEKRNSHAFSYWAFTKVGFFVTLVNLFVYAVAFSMR